ncbi:glycosyltransferase [Bariatricus sp. SGI.154]|uniref:glycosyltransferase n=1 Tax=Bariatricus sp. SGI.154 TaxID=3420549 RepID=UPI003D03933B
MDKILIISGGLQIGGAERVAANISKYAPRGKYEFHYLVFEGIGNVYGAEIETRGGKVFILPSPRQGYRIYIRSLKQLCDKYQYVAVHSHTMFNSGINLFVAKCCGIPCRIAHSHTTKTEVKVSLIQKLYQQIMRFIIRIFSTDLMACGVEAGYWMFGKRAFDKKGVVINNGIDIDIFRWSKENRDKIREIYNIYDKFVVGHSGTIIPLKNQRFLIELLPDLLKNNCDTVLMLIGGGKKEDIDNLKNLANQLGVEENVIFTGAVMNVNEYLSALDVFVFPSFREGTPLALLEAQTNGLPCIVSDCVPRDAFVTDLAIQLPLERRQWIERIIDSKRENAAKYAEIVNSAGYGATVAYQTIYEVYEKKGKR